MKRKKILKFIAALLVVLGVSSVNLGSAAYAASTDAISSSLEKVEVEGLIFKKPVINLYKGTTETIQYTMNPENATNKKLLWESSDPSIASVDENGKITAVSTGSVYITGETTDGTELSAAVEVNVITDKADTIIVENPHGDIMEFKVDKDTIDGFINWYNLRCEGKGSVFFKLKSPNESHYTKIHFEDIFHLTIK
ncbi:MAG: Ig-like domain-containing protein [Clostridium perfringens]|nr:Ig-like domain-containing protein [Clostridium perfringens]